MARASTDAVVTILMPCRNAHVGFLALALDSVFAQSSSSWELIVVDDRTDAPETLRALAELDERGDPRVRVISSRSRHVTGAFNTGMREARTPFVCSLHCDDLLAERAIELLETRILRHPEVDYFHSSRMFVDENGRPLSRVYEARETFDLNDFQKFPPVKALHCWRVGSALAIGGMDESLGRHGGDDYDFTWSMAEAGCTFQAIGDCLYLCRDHREHYRLTTHVPLDVQVDAISKILRKHGVAEDRIAILIEDRKNGYLRQALFADDDDRARKERDGFDIRNGWREPFEPPHDE